MPSVTQPLLALTAADLMSRDVVTLPQHLSLAAAARRLAQSHVSGAPVVDDERRCVGVISAADFVARAEKGEPATRRPGAGCAGVHAAWQLLDVGDSPREEVRQFMTADPVTVAPSTPVREVARMMLDAHVHRVIVVGPDERPVGVVSSTDLLAALAYAGPPASAENARQEKAERGPQPNASHGAP